MMQVIAIVLNGIVLIVVSLIGFFFNQYFSKVDDMRNAIQDLDRRLSVLENENTHQQKVIQQLTNVIAELTRTLSALKTTIVVLKTQLSGTLGNEDLFK
jgi:uncharacterized coiled-coil protein SlyX